MSDTPFLQLLRGGEGVGFQTDDVLAAVLPLFRQVAAWHEQTLVAPLHGLATVVVDTPGILRCARHGSRRRQDQSRRAWKTCSGRWPARSGSLGMPTGDPPMTKPARNTRTSMSQMARPS